MGSRGQSKQKKYASEDRRQREDAKREGARRGAKYYEYTDRKGNTTTGETGNERARGGTYRAKFDEDVVRYANMSQEELERERDRLKNESDTANWGITRAAASRTASAVDQAATADTQIARINQVLRRQSAAVKRAQERAEKRQATRERQAGTPTLNKDLVRRANEASTIFDAGEATQRQYDRDVKEIRSMDLTATEKAQAIRDLHRMTEEQLKAEGQARSPYAAGMGPARFNRRQVSQRADKAAEARQATQNFMNNLRKAQQAKAKQQQAADMKTALSNALANKQLSFEFGGKTWTRKSLRSKTFTAR